MKKYTKILFVCTENTCTSIMAEAVYNHNNKGNISAVSRGIVVLFPEPANPKAVEVLKSNGIDIGERVSVQLDESDFAEGVLVLTMTDDQKRRIHDDYRDYGNVYTINEFVNGNGDVIDPYGRTIDDYFACYKDIAALINKVIYKLYKEEE